ncbi:MAG: hypothetical protein ACOCZ7_00005, partial [Armatimonadota bacterium]
MQFCRTFALLTALIGTALAAALPATAQGTGFRYDTAQRVINACVLAVDVDDDGVVDPPVNPWIFEGMRRPALTPDDWVFENPLAGGTVVPGRTPETLVRGTADYWIVELTDESATRLVGMDVIYLSATTLELTPEQQGGLRAAVEAGAVLWIDSATDPADPTVVTEVVDFPWLMEDGTDNVFGYADADNYVLDSIDESNGLLRDPHPLSSSDVTRLGNWPNRADYETTVYTTGHFLVPTELDPRFHTIIENVAYDDDGNELDASPWAVAMDYGSGIVLVTTGGVGRDVVEWLFEGDAPDADFRPSPNFLQAPDVKMALNAVQWKDSWQHARETPRAAATSVARAPFPLDVVWQYPDMNDDPAAEGTAVPPVIGAVVSTPVYARSMVYAVSNPASLDEGDVPGYLMAFDMRPEQDRDGDEQADDGVADYALGSPYDLVWYSALPENATTRYSSPTLTSAYDYSQVVLISGVDTDDNTAWVAAYNASLEDLGASPVHAEAPGELLWRREIPAYGPTAEVVALSTPVVHKGYVYVLASEYDSALGSNDANSTYGRAHCFELEYPWGIDEDPWAEDASWWVYPAYEQDLSGDGTVVGDEPQRSLPPFHDPEWLALGPAARAAEPLPPAPGAMPVVHADGDAVDGTPADALLTFGTPISFEWDGSAIENAPGGSQYTLVPTPLRSAEFSAEKPAGFGLNANYFLARTNYLMDTYAETALNLGTNPLEPAGLQIDDRLVGYNPGAVRESILNAVDQGWVDPLEAQQNLPVLIDYAQPAPDPAITDEAHTIPGPVRWKRTFERGEPINQPGAMGTDALAVTSGRPVDYDRDPTDPADPPGSGVISQLDASSGATVWSYDPSRAMPGRSGNAQGESTTAAAFDDETIIVGQSAVEYSDTTPSSVSSIIGLNRQMDVQIDLREGVEGQYPVAVRVAWWDRNTEQWEYAELSPASYAVDPWLGRIMFPADSAANLVDADGIELGISIYGRTLQVDWADDGTGNPITEDHLVPAIERFHHTQNFIRLRHYPVVDGSVTIERPDGTPIDVATVAWMSDPQDFGYPDNAAPYDMRLANLDGWIDVSAALDEDGAPVEPGDELLVSYTGWLEEEGRWITVPDPDNNIAVERHQKPVEFGPSLSSPSVAGDTIHLGTQGRDADLNAAFDEDDPRTMLSLIWNKANGFVRSGVSQPADTQPGFAGAVPVVSGAPSITEDRVFVGSRLMSSPDAPGIGPGYVSAMAPWRVLLCDTNRIVETTGSEPSWVCTGTSSPQRTQ